MNAVKKNHPIRTTIWLVGSVGLGLLGAACKPAQQVAEPVQGRSVKVVTLHNGGMEKVVEFPGQVTAVRQSWKAFEVDGRIKEMLVREGEEIRKDQVLARLDKRDYESAREFALAQFEVAESNAARLRPLVEKGAASRQALDLAERDLRTAAANLEQAEKALEDTELVADFDGKVAKLLVEDFANIKAKENVMVIQDDSSLEIVIAVPESVMAIPMPGETDAEKVANAKPVVILSALPDLEIPVHYSESSETSDPVTRTYEVTLAFMPPEGSLVRPGMTAKVRAFIPANEQSRSQGYPVPVKAVFSDDEGAPHLWRVDPDAMTVCGVAVEMGAVVDDQIVVKGPLAAGDLIAASGVHHLREGQQVRAWERP